MTDRNIMGQVLMVCRSFYLGKKVAFVYRGQKEIRGTKIRVIWGKIARPHGKFSLNISEGHC